MSPLRLPQQIEIRTWRVGAGQAVLLWLGTSIFLAAILLPLVAIDEDTHGLRREEALVVLGICFVLCMAAMVGVYQVHRERTPYSYLRLGPDVVSWQWPPGPTIELRYEDLWVAQREGRGRGERLVLRPRGKGAGIDLRVRDFVDPSLAGPVLDTVLERIRELPKGDVLHEEVSQRRTLATLTEKSSLATYLIAVVLVLVFLLERAAGALQEPSRLLALGANSAERVADGELFRLATANLLHVDLHHLALNVVILIVIGAQLEPLVGAGRFLTIFLASALAGAAASALLAQNALSVGASTGTSGLIGAYAVLLKLRPEQLPLPPEKSDWIRLAGSFLLLALPLPNVENDGHIVSLAAGLLLMLASIGNSDLVELQNRHRLFFRISAGLLLAVFLASAAVVVQQSPRAKIRIMPVKVAGKDGGNVAPAPAPPSHAYLRGN